ncbi:MAG: histidinol-phosphate transaminase [Pseudomonadota bacterium]|nr:histidinol-phosphate transaminase [Pseudomonadales bacterium]MDY6918936.1 histidinol-phosphate transaminase [Pseudomonadota bacterium]
MTDSNPIVQQWIRPEIQALKAYQVPPAGNMIKLDAMENPYRWPQYMVDEWLEVLRATPINRYPDPVAAELKEELSLRMGVDPAYEVMLGNGSDELIQIMAMCLAGPDRTLLAPEPGFVMYRMIATFCGMHYRGVPLGEDFELDLPATLEAIAENQPALVFLAQPNNPTGNLFRLESVRAVCEAAPGLVVLDEAYMAFTDRQHLELMADYSNVVVMRTLSKMGLAGLRLGILFGPRAWLQEFDKVRLPYNINVLTEASVKFALTHYDVIKAQTAELRANRAELLAALQQLPFARVWPSEANFILARTAPGQAGAIHQALKTAGILVKCLHGAHPQLEDCLRFTVGTADENRLLLQALHGAMDA